MFSTTYYLLRSRIDGNYLVAYPRSNPDEPRQGYLILFKQDFEALSYLNAHGGAHADKFLVESIPSSQLKALLRRWGYHGLGIVQDALIPEIEFMTISE